MKHTKPAWIRLFALFAIIALVAAACSNDGGGESTTSAADAEEETTTTVEETEEVDPVFRVGLVDNITTDNWWAALDTEDTPQNRAYLTNSKTSLFALTLPGHVMAPAAAATDAPVEPTREGDVWVVEQPMRRDLTWSDGRRLTAEDLVFYFDTVRELGLGSVHAEAFDPAVSSITAPDRFTVRIEFNTQPTLTTWNNGVALAQIPPAHFWQEHVDEAKASGGSTDLYQVSGLGEPSAGPMIVEDWETGSFATTVANPDYFEIGTEKTVYGDGSVRIANSERDLDVVYGGDGAGDVIANYLEGPFVSEIVWVEHESKEEAYEALARDEVDYVLDTDGLTTALRNELSTNSDLNISASTAEGFRYLAFNMRKAPMSDLAFRQAVATVLDKELIAEEILGGSVAPGYTVVHPDLAAHHNPGVDRAGWVDGEPMSEAERFETAIQILTDAGYTWTTEPVVNYSPDGSFVDVTPGEGLTMPNGTRVPELTLLSPGQEFDPYRATFAVWIAEWMNELGIPVVNEATDLEAIVEAAFPPQTPESGMAWDLYILGWGRSEPSLPGTALRAFFHSDQDTVRFGGFNTSGYSNDEFDTVSDAFLSATTVSQAADLTREMEAIVARDLPYVVLFRSRMFEAYNESVQFPVESIMAGHAGFPNGWPAAVHLTE